MSSVRAYSVALIGLVAACTELPTQSRDDQPLGGSRLRVMAGNITSGNFQSYDEGHGIRIFQGVGPDVALVQEMKYSAGARAFVDTAFGTTFEYTLGTGAIPNGVVSRYPILEGGEWDDPEVSDRGFTWARIDVPGTADLWAISVHLLTRSASARDAEARALLAQINAVVPASDWLVIGGDFNTDTRTEAALRTFSSITDTAGPYPADGDGDGDTNASRGKPYDWVLANPALDAREIPVTIGASSFLDGLVVDTRVYAPIAELAPALSTDSGAPSMQHMAVVRDFEMPDAVDPPPATLRLDAPNGGEQWTVGTTQVIRWTSEHLETVSIDYAADGVTFAPIATALPASDGAFTWTVPLPVTTSGVVRIVGARVSDEADGPLATIYDGPRSGILVPADIAEQLHPVINDERARVRP